MGGMVMLVSASMPFAEKSLGDPFAYLYKQSSVIAKSGKNEFSFFSQGKFAWIADGEEEFNLIKNVYNSLL